MADGPGPLGPTRPLRRPGRLHRGASRRRSPLRRWTSRSSASGWSASQSCAWTARAPSPRTSQHRLNDFWLPSQPVLLVEQLAGFGCRTAVRDREDRSRVIRSLRGPGSGSTSCGTPHRCGCGGPPPTAHEEYEDAAARCLRRGRTRRRGSRAQGRVVRAPVGVLRSPSGAKKQTGITQPAAAPGQGPGAAAHHPHRGAAHGGGRRCPRRGEARPPSGTRPGHRADRIGGRLRRTGIAPQDAPSRSTCRPRASSGSRRSSRASWCSAPR